MEHQSIINVIFLKFNYNYFNTDNYPIQSVSAIYVRLTPFAEWTLVDSNDYEVRKEEGKIFLKNIFCWTELKTNYIAGYSLTAMPEDLQEACAKLVTDSFQKSGQNTKPQLGIKSMVNAGNTITFSDVSQEVLNTLDSYKRLII